MGKPVYFVAPWDLNRDLACVPDDPAAGTVLLIESVAKGGALPYHKKKLVLVLSAMHHFAAELRAAGYDVHLINAPTYVEGICRHITDHGSTEVRAMWPREMGLQTALQEADATGTFGVPLWLHDDGGDGGHFLLTRGEFAGWVEGRKTIRMDHFYRWMRKRTGLLMDGKSPVGGKWSYDSENRKPAANARPPDPVIEAPDALTRSIMDRVAQWPGHWGEVDGFDWPVDRAGALRALDAFLDERAAQFGDYQDAMLHGRPFMWHARLSAAMNLSLLHPREVVEAALARYDAGAMPLNAAEGFIRQVIGWREFIRGAYWHLMPDLRDANLLNATRPLPEFYWDPAKTDMRCMQDSITAVQTHGYAHHIQRLMVLGNFALLAGIRPIAVSHWFWAGFVDAYEWVELPNVHNMALYAEGSLTTKPYAASASYINKMSDHCGDCVYRHTQRTGERACPFNHLFWTFMARNRQRLEANPRLGMLYRTWDRWDDAERSAILAASTAFLDGLTPAEHDWSFDDDAC